MSSEKGQAIVLVALLILVLFGMLGLAVDSGRAYVDRRDLQAAVDAAALSAGDWYENYHDLYGKTFPQSEQQFAKDIRDYSGTACNLPVTTFVGANFSLQQDTVDCFYPNSYHLQIVSTNTQFNGYQFQYTATHNLPLAFIQIFGGSPNALISATATAIVGDQRQQPALLTLSTGNCALTLTGSAVLTVVGDTYSNGTACVDPNLKEAGNCYGAAGSNCSAASYWCYNPSPGFSPYDPNGPGPPAHPAGGCALGDTIGNAVVPAPTLPDPGYLATSQAYYSAATSYNQNNRGSWSEMQPGHFAGLFHMTGGSASCIFLDPGVYSWDGGYQSDATGSFVSNELKPPDEIYSANPSDIAPNTAPAGTVPPGGAYGGPLGSSGIQFYNLNATCSGEFNVTSVPITAPNIGVAEKGARNKINQWGVEVTSMRYDTFNDPTVTPNPCFASPGCLRESAPSTCQLTPVGTITNAGTNGIDVNITRNVPGAQYYNVYLNVNGCDGIQSNFAFWGRYLAPGFKDGGGPPASADGSAGNPYPSGSPITLGYPGPTQPPTGVATIMNLNHLGILYGPGKCYNQAKTVPCQVTDPELPSACFSNCSPPPTNLSQDNAARALQYAGNPGPPNANGGDIANENYCVLSANPGNANAPCQGAKITPGAVQFYFPVGQCMTQNAQGATYVFSGQQYNWIVIYAQPASPPNYTCGNTLNGGSSTQYIGTLYSPQGSWTINGGNRSPLAGQVIVYTAKVAGAASVGIDFNPNYAPAPPAARLVN